MRDGLVWVVLSIGALAMGCIWFLGREPIMDLRPMNARGGAFLFSLIVSLVLAVLAVRSFHHGRGSKSSAR
jgi:hypothetical protein